MVDQLPRDLSKLCRCCLSALQYWRLYSRLGNDSIRLPGYELSILQLILCIKISPGTEGFTVVAVAGKHDGVDKATNQNENDII